MDRIIATGFGSWNLNEIERDEVMKLAWNLCSTGEEIFISAYHQKTNPELSDPDGCMLVWFGPQRQSVKSMLLCCRQAFSRKSKLGHIGPVSAYVMN